MNPRPSAPSSATHPREDLHRFVNELNVRYNVGITIPDHGLTPAQRRQNETSAGRIYRRLETHFFHGGLEALTSLCQDFDGRAKGLWSQWVKKPQGDSDTLPHRVHPPLAANLQEREWLQDLFNDILDKAQPSVVAPRRFGRTQSGPAALEAAASSSRSSSDAARFAKPKRPADAELKEASKRPKADSDLIQDLTASASCRRHPACAAASASENASASARIKPAQASMAPSRPGPGLERSFESFSSTTTTSTTALNPSAVFSVSGDAMPTGTQDTAEASSQEHLRPVGLLQAHSQQPCIETPSSTDDAVLTSFDEHDAPFRRPRAKEANSLLSASQSTESSYPPSLGMVEALYVASRLDVESKGTVHSSDRERTSREGAGMSISASAPHDGRGASPTVTTQNRLRGVWPSFPPWLRDAPFPVAWEATRIAQSCGVDLATIQDMAYSDSWKDQQELRKSFARHVAFQANLKDFPGPSDATAWAASLEQSTIMPFDQQVTYSASLDFNDKNTALRLTLQPLKLGQSYRLGRRFGADRFLELLAPSPDSTSLPAFVRTKGSTSFFCELLQFLQTGYEFCGRVWKGLYIKAGGSRKPVKDLQGFGPDQKPVFKMRIYLFAERGCGLPVPVPISMLQLLDWTLDLTREKNQSQPILKLFQRLALVLSKTSPTVVFKPDQIRHRAEDVVSPTGKVMNDGIARMSPAVAREIRKRLGLSVTPSAVQARLGSAKGMWIIDVADNSDDIWIETFPSQRKWDLNWAKDHEHRTLEIRNVVSMPRSASFNMQFLPVIEDRAIDKNLMRMTIEDLLKTNLQTALDDQKRALHNNQQFRQWVHENGAHKHDRLIGHVPYQGAMPREDDELMNCMLDAGFDPTSNKFLVEIAYNIRKRTCEALSKKLNIPIGRSAYLYMTIDFTGILAEDEVHIGFSTAFTADQDWSNTVVQGDVLVARSPAHFISDIQKVRAVFKPELADLKDVVVFSTRGNNPLADKLSGGDYDGDLAWVCWDSRIVDNFENADPPAQLDLSPYMPREKETLRQLLSNHKGKSNRSSKAVNEMMGKCFEFNLTKSMLGICTNYKERLCYRRNNVHDDAAITLSTLLSNLVDQAKQGIRFNADDFDRLRRDFKLPMYVDDPLYKQNNWPGGSGPEHIVDYLKFHVAQPTIASELKSFHAALYDSSTGPGPQHWDMDLATVHKDFTEGLKSSLVPKLKVEIETLARQWDTLMANDSIPFPEKVAQVYALWQGIQPRGKPTTAQILTLGGEMSLWAQLKASTAFWMYCNTGTSFGLKPRFVWQMACRQLCQIKAQAVTSRALADAEGAPSVVIPIMYAGLRPDAKYIKQMVARLEGEGSQFGFGEEYSGDDDARDVDD